MSVKKAAFFLNYIYVPGETGTGGGVGVGGQRGQDVGLPSVVGDGGPTQAKAVVPPGVRSGAPALVRGATTTTAKGLLKRVSGHEGKK